jgi:hypothetical protein
MEVVKGILSGLAFSFLLAVLFVAFIAAGM